MFLMRFTERAYVAYSEEDVRNSFRSSVRLTFPNSHFNPALGADMYNEYLDEYEYADEIGFDGLMLNEHHNTPTCMGAAMNLEAAILARTTKNAKIVLLGNPLPILDNPIRLAEELAEIDMISRGRLVSGFVRGTGIESWATNTNPAYNRERFQEAHDLASHDLPFADRDIDPEFANHVGIVGTADDRHDFFGPNVAGFDSSHYVVFVVARTGNKHVRGANTLFFENTAARGIGQHDRGIFQMFS